VGEENALQARIERESKQEGERRTRKRLQGAKGIFIVGRRGRGSVRASEAVVNRTKWFHPFAFQILQPQVYSDQTSSNTQPRRSHQREAANARAYPAED